MKRGLTFGACFLLALGLFILPVTANAAKKLEFSLGTGMPDIHATSVAFMDLAKELEEKSGGTMTGVLYPSNQLGGDLQMTHSLLDHALVMQYVTTANLVSFIPELAAFDIPFQFAKREDADRIFSDPEFMAVLGKYFERAGFKLLYLDCPGFRWLTANRPIRNLEDLQGVKVRTMENPYHVAFWRALGASPTPLANSERYTALQQGTVDGQENVMENAFITRMYEVQSDFINTQHIAYIGSWIMDLAFWNKLTKEQQDLFMDLLRKYCDRATKEQVEKEGRTIKELQEKYKKNVILELDPGEYERWAKIARPVAEEMVRAKIGDEMVDALTKARGN
jgi:TRAP-type C4-dicarboxylate transport system, periplasmic component